MSEQDQPSREVSQAEILALAERLLPVLDSLGRLGLTTFETGEKEGIEIQADQLLNDGKVLSIKRYVFSDDERWHIAINEAIASPGQGLSILSKQLVIYNYPGDDEYPTENDYYEAVGYVNANGAIEFPSVALTLEAMELAKHLPEGCTQDSLEAYQIALAEMEQRLGL